MLLGENSNETDDKTDHNTEDEHLKQGIGSRLRQISCILIMHPGLASVQPVYSGFGNYIVGEWPIIGHKWLLSVVFVLMDGAPHGHILQRNGEISNNYNNRLCWSQRQVALPFMTDDWPFSNNIISKSAINRLNRCKPRMHYQDA
jgi:hypothetical protein